MLIYFERGETMTLLIIYIVLACIFFVVFEAICLAECSQNKKYFYSHFKILAFAAIFPMTIIITLIAAILKHRG